MKRFTLIPALLFSSIAAADLFDTPPEKFCNLFIDEGVVPTDYGPGSNPDSKLCYTTTDHEKWEKTGYRISYRVLGHWKWRELTGNAYISIEGLEPRIVEDGVLSKYRRMVHRFLETATSNTGSDKLSKIAGAVVSENRTTHNIEAISIRSYIARRKHGDQERIEYRVNINNRCMYHPDEPSEFRARCLAEYE